MTRLLNVPARFAHESLVGFAVANAERVALTSGNGVKRADSLSELGTVIVMGGGAGHFPAFAGWVGPGLVDLAVSGNIFASPSQEQIVSAVRDTAAEHQNVLFLPINYAGDILHFGAAAKELIDDGRDARTVIITDDIASGSEAQASTRRGVAGSLIVAKVVGAANARGYAIDELERIATAINTNTRTIGIAFSGCTLPGSDEPLFSIPDGEMAVGMGIHGEPGLAMQKLGSANEVADSLVDELVEAVPFVPGSRVAVLVNGLGATKYDELNLIFARVLSRLESEDVAVVAPLVGEYMTSLEMEGLSISIAVLDEESEQLWRDPVDSWALSRRSIPAGTEAAMPSEVVPDASARRLRATDNEASRQAAHAVERALQQVLREITDQQRYLGDLDAIAGDGDHGTGMLAGIGAASEAAAEAVAANAGAQTTLRFAGEQWSAVAGGTSGALWGAGLVAAAGQLSDDDGVGPTRILAAVEAFADKVVSVGGAQLGDKTMVDAIVPFRERFSTAIYGSPSIGSAWQTAAETATIAARDTAGLVSRRGRSRIHGDKSLGTPDPGAVSFAMVVSVALLGTE